MVRLKHDGLELWYATPDAPAPEGTTEERAGTTVTVGVRPASPTNAVSVRFRVDGQGIRTISAPLVATDFRVRTQYFRATFPTFWSGETVDYLPVATCSGRRTPDPATASTFPSTFRLAAPPSPAPSPPPLRSPAPAATFPARLEHLAHVRVCLMSEPEVIGETPAGFVMNWAPLSGTLDGPALRATVIPGGEHQTVVRADGTGDLTVSVTVRTHDRALIGLSYTGTVDFGADWPARGPGGKWPDVLPVRSGIRLLTSAPAYQWLNRLLCLGIGEVRPADDLYIYDMYAVR